MLGWLAAWNPEAPKVADLINDLEPPPGRLQHPDQWPAASGLDLSERQLRARENWASLATFAADRLRFIETHAPPTPGGGEEAWSGIIKVTNGKARRISRQEESEGAKNRWLELLVEAQLQEGKLAEATQAAHRLMREGGRGSHQKLSELARSKHADGIARILATPEGQP